jgi:predicted phage tail protein
LHDGVHAEIEIKIVRGFAQIKSGIFYGGTLLCGVGKNFLKQIGASLLIYGFAYLYVYIVV